MSGARLLPTAYAQAAPESQPCGPPDEANLLCDWVLDATSNEYFARASDVLIVRPAKIVLIVVLALVATRLFRRLIGRFVQGLRGETVRRRISTLRDGRSKAGLAATAPPTLRTAQRAEAVGALLRSTTTVVVWSIAVIMILEQLDLSVGPLLAGAGVIGIAIGFGAQNLVRDILTGLFMLVEDQYGVGDIIDVGPATGTVEGISLRTTRLRDVEGTVWHVPNGTIDRVGNKSQQWSRALLDIDVAYGSDITEARRVIKEAADGVYADPDWRDMVLEEPEVWGIEMLGENSVSIRLVVKTKPLSQWAVARELRARIKAAFDANGIEIPFPQRVVWVRAEGAGAGSFSEPNS